LERTVTNQDKEIERLTRELKDQKEKTAQAQKEARETLRSDATTGIKKKHDKHEYKNKITKRTGQIK
jgi:hypothetical protein